MSDAWALVNGGVRQALERVYALFEAQVGAQCARSLLRDRRIAGNAACVRLALSKALGMGIVAGAAVVKVPQILALAVSRSADGLSSAAYVLETAAAIVTFSYNLRAGSPFTTYGEVAFLVLQNFAILAMIASFRGQLFRFAAVFVAFGSALSVLQAREIVSDAIMVRLQAATIPLVVASRVPQIWTLWRAKRTGALSLLSTALIALGSCARVYTSLSETPDDRVLVAGYSASALLNVVLALMVAYYAVCGQPRMRVGIVRPPAGRPFPGAKVPAGARPPSSLAKPSSPRPPSSLAKPAPKAATPVSPTKSGPKAK